MTTNKQNSVLIDIIVPSDKMYVLKNIEMYDNLIDW